MKTRRHAFTCLRDITFVIALSLAPAATLWADSPQVAASPPPSMAGVQAAYGQLPLSFEANQGQVDPEVQFLTRGRGHQLFLTPSEVVLALRTYEAKAEGRADEVYRGKSFSSPSASSHSVVRMTFEGANPQAEVVGLDQLPGIVNYFIGDDPSKWHTHIPTYQKVEYKHIYPGIDLVYYGNQGQLEYDLIVAPGADPNLIRLVFDGAEKVEVDPATCDLVLTLSKPSANSELSTENSALAASAKLRLHKPVVYQRDEHGEKHLLAGTYVLLAAEASSHRPASEALDSTETPHVAFQIASYDASQPLIIDPVLSWATYLGGSGSEGSTGIAVDQEGNAYVTGSTNTPGSGFPGTAGSSIQSTLAGAADAFVTKLNATGTALVYSTYLGGSGTDQGYGIAVDQAGQAYVTGLTDTPGSGFPGITGSSFQSTNGGGYDAFVAKITDNMSPVCSAAQAIPASLWAPNHQFAPIVILGVTDPENDPVTLTVLGVRQDEPVLTPGSDNTSPDAVIQAGSASVRAERLNSGNGRVYHLAFKAEDGQGGTCTGDVTVGVPHSKGKGVTAIDGGPAYDSTIP